MFSKIKKLLKDKKYIRLFIFFFALVLGGALIPSRFAFTLTPSLDHRVYFIDSNPAALKKGNYVMFYLTSKYYGDKPLRVMKQIACDEGEALKNVGNDFWCNHNEYIGKAKEYSLKGEKLEHFVYEGAVPKGYAFVAGHHKDSFDSRYFGFVKKSEMIAKAYPIF